MFMRIIKLFYSHSRLLCLINIAFHLKRFCILTEKLLYLNVKINAFSLRFIHVSYVFKCKGHCIFAEKT